MTDQFKDDLQSALVYYRKLRGDLCVAQIVLDTKKHRVRRGLYAEKESGERKLTEEQIRSISMVECEAENKAVAEAQADYDNAKETLEVLKLIASN